MCFVEILITNKASEIHNLCFLKVGDSLIVKKFGDSQRDTRSNLTGPKDHFNQKRLPKRSCNDLVNYHMDHPLPINNRQWTQLFPQQILQLLNIIYANTFYGPTIFYCLSQSITSIISTSIIRMCSIHYQISNERLQCFRNKY